MTDIAIERGMDTVEIPRSILMFFTVAMMLLGLVASVKLLDWAVDTKLAHVTTTSQITAEFRDRQLNCLAKNIYYEAGSEPFEGKVAVAQVTLNRAASSRFPDDVCKVIYQKNVFYEKVVCQFSWYCDRASTVKPVNSANYNESMVAAKKVLLEDFRLPSLKNALFYHADYVSPGWKKEPVAKIGHHIFYN
jgi:spore germination cell wall hydrolase CwlJ-like protein